ncbi:MAG TPA: type II secretion system F family protein [Burkholderiales bacterium]|nr:type II secretion system F family protein [Burkholderiales bacterium]
MKFQVKALRDQESVVSVLLDAADEADAERQARANGLAVLSLRRAMTWNFELFGRRSRFPLAHFAQELLALLEAGLTLVESIEALAEKESHGPTRAVLGHLIAQLRQGRALSHAMQDLPQAFPVLFVASVRATEKTGDVPDALRRYLGYQAQMELVRRKIVSASIYPVLLMGAGLLVLLFLLGYVVPKFSHVYEDIQGDLPLMSQLLLKLGKFVGANGLAVAVIGAVAAALAVRLAISPAARGWLVERFWRVPAIGGRMRLYQLARFYRTLGMLLRGGTPVLAALDMASGLLVPALQPGLARARQAIREGQAISEAMSAQGLTTPVALRMLRVGERSGRMDEMMDRIAGFLDDEIARWVDWFTRLFEPLLMAFIGVVIGIIVVLMYLPVFELAGSIQ